MKVLELAQEISDKRKKLNMVINGHIFCVLDHYAGGLKFSAWVRGHAEDAPIFNADLELFKDNDYTGDIEAAREALKQYLTQEVK